MIAITSWLPDVLPSLPGCPEPSVIRAIRDAAIEFCNRSLIWRHEMEPIPVVKGIGDYELDVPRDANIAGFIRVRHSDRVRPLELRTSDELDDMSPGWRTAYGTPQFFVQHGKYGILLDRLPAETKRNVLSATIALKPSSAATTLPDVLYTDWKDQITDGARERLMVDVNRQWSDPARAEQSRMNFRAGIERAELKARLGSGARDLSVRKRRVF